VTNPGNYVLAAFFIGMAVPLGMIAVAMIEDDPRPPGFRRLVLIVLALLMLGAWLSKAHAHGPWPWACCADNDCDEIDARFVREYPEDDTIRIAIPPGGHKLWGPEQTTTRRVTLHRSQLKKPVTGEWGLCIKPYTFEFLCAFPPMVSG